MTASLVPLLALQCAAASPAYAGNREAMKTRQVPAYLDSPRRYLMHTLRQGAVLGSKALGILTLSAGGGMNGIDWRTAPLFAGPCKKFPLKDCVLTSANRRFPGTIRRPPVGVDQSRFELRRNSARSLISPCYLLEIGMESLLVSCGPFHPLQFAGLARRSLPLSLRETPSNIKLLRSSSVDLFPDVCQTAQTSAHQQWQAASCRKPRIQESLSNERIAGHLERQALPDSIFGTQGTRATTAR